MSKNATLSQMLARSLRHAQRQAAAEASAAAVAESASTPSWAGQFGSGTAVRTDPVRGAQHEAVHKNLSDHKMNESKNVQQQQPSPPPLTSSGGRGESSEVLSLLRLCLHTGDWETALETYVQYEGAGTEHRNVAALRTCARICSEHGAIAGIDFLVDRTPAELLLRDSATVDHCISGYAQQDLHDKVVAMTERVLVGRKKGKLELDAAVEAEATTTTTDQEKEGTEEGKRPFVSALSSESILLGLQACEASSQWQRAVLLVQDAAQTSRRGTVSPTHYAVLVAMLESQKQYDVKRRVIEGMPESAKAAFTEAYVALISVWSRRKPLGSGPRLGGEQRASYFQPEDHGFSS